MIHPEKMILSRDTLKQTPFLLVLVSVYILP